LDVATWEIDDSDGLTSSDEDSDGLTSSDEDSDGLTTSDEGANKSDAEASPCGEPVSKTPVEPETSVAPTKFLAIPQPHPRTKRGPTRSKPAVVYKSAEFVDTSGITI
jgi:hypothetical protein